MQGSVPSMESGSVPCCAASTRRKSKVSFIGVSRRNRHVWLAQARSDPGLTACRPQPDKQERSPD